MNAEHIRTAIAEVLEAALTATFKRGVFPGQPLQAQQSMSMQDTVGVHWFDVQIADEEPHASSPVSARDPRRVLQLSITIPVTSHVATTAQDAERALKLSAIASDCDDAAQALSEPGALDETDDGDATGIVSGLMFGPGRSGTPTWRLVQEDWGAQLVRSAIVGSLIVNVEAV